MKQLLVDIALKEQLQERDVKEFEDLLEASACNQHIVGKTLTGLVTRIEQGNVYVDVGLKSEGKVPLREFCPSGLDPNVNVGDQVELFLENIEGRDHAVVLSREKAVREEAWIRLSEIFAKNERINGVMFGKIRGGYAVDLDGVVAFLPGSHIDIRPIKDKDALMGIEQPFKILKMEKERNNIVVSRKAVLAEDLADTRSSMIETLKEGKVIKTVVKNITEYGAFLDVNGVFDGLLHVTDMSWKRVNKPSDMVSVGQELEVVILSYDAQKQRVALGLKQLTPDPWESVEENINMDTVYNGTITSITDYGAFVELDNKLEGLIHVSEMSWSKRNISPHRTVEIGQKVKVKILEIDKDRRRIAMGMKQCVANPWLDLENKFPVGSEIEGKIRNITEFGLFVQLAEDIDGMVHLYDISWSKKPDEAIAEYNKGDTVKVKVLEVAIERERIALGIKQLEPDPFKEAIEGLKEGMVVTTKIKEIEEEGLLVSIEGRAVKAVIRRLDLSKDRAECNPERFAVGEKLDAKIVNIDRQYRKVLLSVRALEIDEEKVAMDKYGSADSGASLGDILGKVLQDKDLNASKDVSKDDSKVNSKVESKTAAKKTSRKADDSKEVVPAKKSETKDLESKEATKKPTTKKTKSKAATTKANKVQATETVIAAKEDAAGKKTPTKKSPTKKAPAKEATTEKVTATKKAATSKAKDKDEDKGKDEVKAKEKSKGGDKDKGKDKGKDK